jgi:hypothetical protein
MAATPGSRPHARPSGGSTSPDSPRELRDHQRISPDYARATRDALRREAAYARDRRAHLPVFAW